MIIWSIIGILTTPSQSEPGSNDNEGVFQILQMSRTGASPLDVV